MSNRLVKILSSLTLVLLSLSFYLPVYADVAPDPIVRSAGYLLPSILVAAVVIGSVVLLNKGHTKK